MKMFLTRIGFGSTAVITGDVTQVDLPKGTRSGLVQREEGLQKDIKRIYPEISELKLSDRGLGSTIVKFRRN